MRPQCKQSAQEARERLEIMTTDKAPKSIAAILASADLMLADSREMAAEARVLLADARALSAEYDVVLVEQAKLKARLLEPC